MYVLNHPFAKGHKLRLFTKMIWWKINRRFFKLPCIVELVHNIKIICYPNDSLYSTLIVYLILPEYGEMKFLLEILNKDDNFIDIGANMGIYSLLASSKIEKGRIFSFEPSPKILPQLYENIALNNKKNCIRVIEKAVSGKEGYINFDVSDSPDYNHIVYPKEAEVSFAGDSVLRVGTITLDKFISGKNIKNIKLIKIDVEGAELLVLKGLQKTLEEKKVAALIVEISKWTISRFGTTVEEIVYFLRKYGFDIYMFDKNFNLIELSSGKNQGWNIIAIHKSRNDIIKRFNRNTK